MMKKIALMCAACVFVLTACQTMESTLGNTSENTPENNPKRNPVRPDAHTARVALDVPGRYEVGKQVAGYDVREIRIRSGNRYTVTLANGINVSGLYRWDVSDSRIILDIRGDQTLFFVGENFLKYEGAGKQKDWIFQKM